MRLPITGPIMTRIYVSLVASSRTDRQLIWAVVSLAFFGFFRLGELLVEAPDQYVCAGHLSWGNVAVDNRTYVPCNGEGPLEAVEVRPIRKGSRCDCGADRHTHLPSNCRGVIHRATAESRRALLHHSAGVPCHEVVVCAASTGCSLLSRPPVGRICRT